MRCTLRAFQGMPAPQGPPIAGSEHFFFEAAAPYIAVTMLEAMEARIAKGAKARPSKTDESRAPASPTGVAKSRSSERLERAVALDGQINAPP